MNAITIKQKNFILSLDPTKKEKELESLDICQASKLIKQLLKLKQNKQQAKKAEIKRNHNFKVGDVFVMTWGYDQTNNDFFRVCELVGADSIRIQEVRLETKTEEWYKNGMAKDVEYNPSIYSVSDHSIFIKDQKKGDLKRVSHPKWSECGYYIGIQGHSLRLYNGGKLYASYYA